MKYFNNITSFAELKKQFRNLVLTNHPDRGGSTEAMQAINNEFQSLYKIWKDKVDTTATNATGYESDYEGATAKEYTEHVYNEYNWKGERYNSNLDKSDLVEIFRDWLKKTYPSCKFTVNSKGWNSINVHIMKMDFNPFTSENPKLTHNVNTYHCGRDSELNDRARDIVSNIISYMNSYNYDNSDSMTDYFDCGFYAGLEFGNNSTLFAVEIPKSRRTGGVSDPEFIRPVGKAHAVIKKALGKAYFNMVELSKGDMCVLGEDYIYSELINFHPLTYAGRKTAEKRVLKLQEAGILCDIVDYYIVFRGYTEEVEKALAEEDRAANEAEKAWNEAKKQKSESKTTKEEKPVSVDPIETSELIETIQSDTLSIEIVDYSEKAVAVFGDTKQIKDQLTELGGRFNKYLSYKDGKRAGWIFPKSKWASLQALCQPQKKQGIDIFEDIIKPGDLITFNTYSFEYAETYKGVVEYKDQLGLIVFVNGMQYELKKLLNIKKEKATTIEEKKEDDRPVLNDGSYMAFVSCVQKRLLSAGYEAGRKYIKNHLQRYIMRIDQLRYLAFLLSDFSQRYGTMNKAGAA